MTFSVISAAKEQYNSAASVFDECLNTASMMLDLVTDTTTIPPDVQVELNLLEAASIVSDFGCTSIVPLELRLTVPRTSLLRRMLKRSQSLQGDQSEQLLLFASLLNISDDKAKNIIYTAEIRKHAKAGHIEIALAGCWKLLTQFKSNSNFSSSEKEENVEVIENASKKNIYTLCSEVVRQVLEIWKKDRMLNNNGGLFQLNRSKKSASQKEEQLIHQIITSGLVDGPSSTLPSFIIYNQTPWTLLPPIENAKDDQENLSDWTDDKLSLLTECLLNESGTSELSYLYQWRRTSTNNNQPRASLFRRDSDILHLSSTNRGPNVIETVLNEMDCFEGPELSLSIAHVRDMYPLIFLSLFHLSFSF